MSSIPRGPPHLSTPAHPPMPSYTYAVQGDNTPPHSGLGVYTQARRDMHTVNLDTPGGYDKDGKDYTAGERAAKKATAAHEDAPTSRGMVVFSVLFYLVAALVMIMANKWVLNSVPVPLFFLFVQLTIAVVLLHLSAVFGYFTIPPVHLQTCKALLPLVGINVMGLVFNTYCLQYVDASFYQVARGLVLPFTTLFSYLLLSTRSSPGALLAVAVVCVGFFLGVSAEHLHTSTLGTMLGVFSSLTTSVHAIVVKRSLSVVRGSTMDLVYYNNLLSAILLFPLVLLSREYSTVLEMTYAGGLAFHTFLSGAVITGVFGFLICIAGFLSIKVTSPVTHMISSAVRGVIQTFLGAWCFGDIITAGRGAGIFFILLGSTMYTYVKDREQRAKEGTAMRGRHQSLPQQTDNSSQQPPLRRIPTPPNLESSNNAANESIRFQTQAAGRGLTVGTPSYLGSRADRDGYAFASSAAMPVSNTVPSPRTPHQFEFNPDTFAGDTSTMSETFFQPHLHHHNQQQQQQQRPGSSHSVLRTLSPYQQTRNNRSDRRMSYNGSEGGLQTSPTRAPLSRYADQGGASDRHGKSLSVSDLRDVLVAPNDKLKQGKMF